MKNSFSITTKDPTYRLNSRLRQIISSKNFSYASSSAAYKSQTLSNQITYLDYLSKENTIKNLKTKA